MTIKAEVNCMVSLSNLHRVVISRYDPLHFCLAFYLFVKLGRVSFHGGSLLLRLSSDA